MTDLLSSAIAADGGLDRGRSVRAIDVTFNVSGGPLDLRGSPCSDGLRRLTTSPYGFILDHTNLVVGK